MKNVKRIVLIMILIIVMSLGYKDFLQIKEDKSKESIIKVNRIASDFDFKSKIFFRNMHLLKLTHEFKDYIQDENNNFYYFFKFFEKFNSSFYIPEDTSLSIGFYDISKSRLIFEGNTHLYKKFFKENKIDIQKIIDDKLKYYTSDNYIYTFDHEFYNQNYYIWFKRVDLKRTFDEVFEATYFNLAFYDDNRNLIFSKGEVDTQNSYLIENRFGFYTYSVNKVLNFYDLFYLSIYIILGYLIYILLLHLYKVHERLSLVEVASILPINNKKDIEVEDIVEEINLLVAEKKEVQINYLKSHSEYINLLFKDFILGSEGLNINKVYSVFSEYNCKIRLIVTDRNDNFLNEISQINKENVSNFILEITPTQVCIIIKDNETEWLERVRHVAFSRNVKMYISRCFDDLEKVNGCWNFLKKEITKYNMIHNDSLIYLEEFNNTSINSKDRNYNKSFKRELLKDKMLKFIEDNYQYDISLNDLAIVLEESPKYASFLFKKYININFKDFLTYYRIEKAKEIMTEDREVKVTLLHEMVGYSNITSFIRAFKKSEGVSPGVWKKSLSQTIE